jgi:transcriptional regulator with XRE-family HTH domain
VHARHEEARVKTNQSPENLEIGRRIAQARRDRGLTQKQLAELTGVKERSVQAWEQGETNPYRRIRGLESALGLPGTWLLHGLNPDEAKREHIMELKSDFDQDTLLDENRLPFRRDTGPEERSFVVDGFLRLSERLAAVEARLDAIESSREQRHGDSDVRSSG